MNMPSQQIIENFLYDEAELLDCADLGRWMDLFTEDGTYWMPATPDQADPLNHISHIYDDRVMMEIRKRNFVHPRAASKEPSIRCSHLLGNIRLQGASSDGLLRVCSKFHVVVWYRENQRIYAGNCEHLLRYLDGELKIYRKRVDLLDADGPQQSLIVYL